MELTIDRSNKLENCTVSTLFKKDKALCFVLEDKFREVEGQPVETWKVPGKTAIPKGTYNVVMTMSARFKIVMPLLENVSGFAGVRIHSGNTSESTEGCLLCGITWDGKSDFIGESKKACTIVYGMIENELKAGNKVTLTIS